MAVITIGAPTAWLMKAHPKDSTFITSPYTTAYSQNAVRKGTSPCQRRATVAHIQLPPRAVPDYLALNHHGHITYHPRWRVPTSA